MTCVKRLTAACADALRRPPSKGDEGLAVLLVELPAIELLDEIRANVVGAGQRFVAAEPVDLAVIAAGKDRRNRDASPRGGLVY